MTSVTNIEGTVVRERGQASPVSQTESSSTWHDARMGGGKELPSRVTSSPYGDSARLLDEAVHKVNDFVQNYQRQLSFSVHKETGITVVKVIDRETDEVIRQIPPEEVLAIAEQIQAMMADKGGGKGMEGMLVREKA